MPRVPPVTSATRAMFASLAVPLPGACRFVGLASRHLNEIMFRSGRLPAHFDPSRGRRAALAWRPVADCGVARPSTLDAERDAHAAADAERGQALVRIALLHLVQQRDEHTGARGADRVAEGDGAAVDVDLAGVPAEVLVDGAGLGGEGLVGLDQVE